jgi:hypothetical protein
LFLPVKYAIINNPTQARDKQIKEPITQGVKAPVWNFIWFGFNYHSSVFLEETYAITIIATTKINNTNTSFVLLSIVK